MRKKLLLLAGALLAVLQTAKAYDFSAVVSSGQTLYFNIISDSLHTVAVTSPLSSYPYYSIGSTKPSGALVIPDTVMNNGVAYNVISIGNHAFDNCGIGITSVAIPNGVNFIGDYAFYYSLGLNSVNIPYGVTYIGSYAFSYTGLSAVTIPNTVNYIGSHAFETSNLTSVTIPNGIITIERTLFINVLN